MNSETGTRFPKSARLLKSKDFRFKPFRRFQTPHFSFFYTSKGAGRVGISISKRVLKRATARNRVRRLIREVFRHRAQDVVKYDVHLVARSGLTEVWEGWTRDHVEREWDGWFGQL